MFGSDFPNGNRLTKTSPVKLRSVALQDVQNYDDSFWGINWSESDLTQIITTYKTFGVNCVCFFFTGLPSQYSSGNGPIYGTGYPSLAVCAQRFGWLCNLLRNNGMVIHLRLNSLREFYFGNINNNIQVNVNMLRIALGIGGDLITSIDICNEINFGEWPNYAAGSAALSLLNSAIRQNFPGVPLTAAVFISTKDELSGYNPWLDLQYDLGFDFHGYHPYYDFGYNSFVPTGSDVSAIASRAKFIGRVFLNECGTGLSARIPGNAPTSQTDWANGMGDAARDYRCFGANWWCTRPYFEDGSGITPTNFSDPYQYGILNYQLQAPNAAITTSLSRWPAIT